MPIPVQIAQAIALTVNANAFLQGREIGPFWPNGRAFKPCVGVQFVAASETSWSDYDPLLSPDPNAWLNSLQDRCTSVRLRPFVGGSDWVMEEIGESAPCLWVGEWRSWRRREDAVDGRSSLVRYRRAIDETVSGDPLADDLEDARNRLSAAITTIADFAARNDLGFAEEFANGLFALGSDDPLVDAYFDDLAAPGFLSPLALQVLGACEAAAVFGGQDSWPLDGYRDELIEGNALSADLLEALRRGLAAVANSTIHQP